MELVIMMFCLAFLIGEAIDKIQGNMTYEEYLYKMYKRRIRKDKLKIKIDKHT